MNESRRQVYLNLIDLLLNCPSGEEEQILNANLELIDAGLVQMMLEEAANLIQQSNLEKANYLMNIAGKLLGVYTQGNSSAAATSEMYVNLLIKVLQKTDDSGGEAQQVYPLLQDNLDKLNDDFVSVLRDWATAKLSEVESEEAQYIAQIIFDFSNLIREFPLGSIASNLEIAIAGYEVAATVFTRSAFPQNWAAIKNNLALVYSDRIQGDKAENLETAIRYYQAALEVDIHSSSSKDFAGTQYNLANAYRKRIKGDKAENLETAIRYYQAALEVRTRSAFPQDWAMTQNDLAYAYSDRIKGDKAENLEAAIRYYQAALEVYTRSDFSQDWAGNQHNLANTYRKRIKGDKAENLEMAIRYFQAVLEVYTRSDFPQDWALTQNNLAVTYLERIKGDKAKNLETAIRYSQAALEVRIRSDFPQDWAGTHNNLASAYGERIKGDKAENLETAIHYLLAALEVYTRSDFPEDWAMTQHNLAAAYLQRIKGDKAENLETAIRYFLAALEVYTRSDFPQNWAITQNNLANAYYDRIKGNKAENLETAIRYCQDALEVRTRSAFPQDWAMTQHNLANAYSDRIKGDKAENLEMAIRYFLAALEVFTRSAFPQNCTETLFGLGRTYQQNNQKHLAYDAFADAIETVELLREEIVSGEESKQKLAEQHNKIYLVMVELCLVMGKPTAAIEYAERSKTRNLVEQILTRDLHNIFPLEVVKELEQLRDEIATNQNQIQTGIADNPQTLAQRLQQLRQQRNNLQNRYLPIGFGFNFERFQKTLDDSTAIIQWYITYERFHTFIFTRHSPQPFILSATIDDRNALINWAITYIDDYYEQKDNWRTQLTPRLQELAKILHLDEILAHLPKDCQQLILIPHVFLHLFPLHALPVGESCLLDIFPKGVSYAPSCQLLMQAQKRQRPDFSHLFAIQNPTEDLTYTDLEVEVITQYFQPVNVLKKTQATLSAINNTPLNTFHCAHFSCHGYFDLTDARKSALILANAPLDTAPTQPNSERYLSLRNGETHDLEKCLTLDRILSLKLEKCRLVTLSACETGLIDFRNDSDEYIGLPSGFLIAGSPAVVSSLWTVSDLSTAFLMMKFYDNLQTYNSITLALNHAQKWLRSLTCEEFETLLNKYKPQIEQIFAQIPDKKERIKAKRRLEASKRLPYPFADPFYWAAFTANGL